MSQGSLLLRAGLASLCYIFAAPAFAQDAVSAPSILTYRGPDREQRLLEGAKKEGEVVFYSAMITNQALRPITAAFQKKYPDLKLTYWRGDSEDIALKLSAEIRANSLKVDIVEGTGIGEMAVKAGFALPAWSPQLASIPENIRDQRQLWMPTRMSYFSAAYNTRLVPTSEMPTTFEGLLDPKWKGKIAWPLTASSAAPLFVTNLRIAWGEEKARDYLEKLSKQDVINFGSGNARTLVDRVIAGEYAIALAIFAHHPFISAAKGAPVASMLMPPVASAAGTMVVPKGVRHPHAALLLIDFLLSREGQEILASAEYLPVRPDVEAIKAIAPVIPSKSGIQENFISPEKLNAYTDDSYKLLQELFRK